eukprot:234520-Chlamydomonas_euryale.AAC.1
MVSSGHTTPVAGALRGAAAPTPVAAGAATSAGSLVGSVSDASNGGETSTAPRFAGAAAAGGPAQGVAPAAPATSDLMRGQLTDLLMRRTMEERAATASSRAALTEAQLEAERQANGALRASASQLAVLLQEAEEAAEAARRAAAGAEARMARDAAAFAEARSAAAAAAADAAAARAEAAAAGARNDSLVKELGVLASRCALLQKQLEGSGAGEGGRRGRAHRGSASGSGTASPALVLTSAACVQRAVAAAESDSTLLPPRISASTPSVANSADALMYIGGASGNGGATAARAGASEQHTAALAAAALRAELRGELRAGLRGEVWPE